jgi:hypothetical protein
MAGGMAYVCDYVSLRYRIPNNRAQFGSVVVQVSHPAQAATVEYRKPKADTRA